MPDRKPYHSVNEYREVPEQVADELERLNVSDQSGLQMGELYELVCTGGRDCSSLDCPDVSVEVFLSGKVIAQAISSQSEGV